MATATATAEIASARTSRWTYLLAYLAAVIVAEILIAIPGPPNGEGRPFQPIGLAIRRWNEVPLQLAVAMTGIPLGLLEFSILRPPKWIPQETIVGLLGGGLVIFLATGLSEELIFRGILLKRAVEALNDRDGLLYVTLIFASLHIFFLNGLDLVFVFAVGLFYGFVVLQTKNLWGVILSHSLGNVILYLVAPFH